MGIRHIADDAQQLEKSLVDSCHLLFCIGIFSILQLREQLVCYSHHIGKRQTKLLSGQSQTLQG